MKQNDLMMAAAASLLMFGSASAYAQTDTKPLAKEPGEAAAAATAAVPASENKAETDDPHGHGEAHDLGTTTVAGLKFKTTMAGKAKGGGELAVEVIPEKGQKSPKAVRSWVGNSTARGSVKAKGEKEESAFHLHVEVPKKLMEEYQLWIEVEPAEGKKEKAAFDLE